MDDKIGFKWAEFSSDNENVPPCTEFLKFLDLQTRYLVSVCYTGRKHASGFDRKMPFVKPC